MGASAGLNHCWLSPHSSLSARTSPCGCRFAASPGLRTALAKSGRTTGLRSLLLRLLQLLSDSQRDPGDVCYRSRDNASRVGLRELLAYPLRLFVVITRPLHQMQFTFKREAVIMVVVLLL